MAVVSLPLTVTAGWPESAWRQWPAQDTQGRNDASLPSGHGYNAPTRAVLPGRGDEREQGGVELLLESAAQAMRGARVDLQS